MATELNLRLDLVMTLSHPAGFKGRFETSPIVCAAYSEAAGPLRIVPRAVAIPESIRDLVSLVEYAHTEGTFLTPRGSGSGMPGGNLSSHVVVDMCFLRDTLQISDDGIATVSSGRTYRELSDLGVHRGLRLPPNPSSGDFCTLAGMVSTNAAGPRSVKYGSVRKWVQAIELVTADGETGWVDRAASSPTRDLTVLSRLEAQARPDVERLRDSIAAKFPKTTKNSSGYALDEYLNSKSPVDLIIGSEGTLALISRIRFALDPLPSVTGVLRLAIADLDVLSDIVATIKSLDPSAVELLSSSLLRHSAGDFGLDLADVEAVLLVEFEGSTNREIRNFLTDGANCCSRYCHSVEGATERSTIDQLWSIRHAASSALAHSPEERRSLQIIEDGCVPVSQLGGYLKGVHQIASDVGLEIVAFGHAGDGHLHVNALVDVTDPKFQKRLSDLLEQVTALLLELGGTPSGEHGDGRLRAGLLEKFYGEEIVGLFRRVKLAFDPTGILNPGVILPDGDDQIGDRLKVGPAAAHLPPEVESRLRQIERDAAWGPAIEITRNLLQEG